MVVTGKVLPYEIVDANDKRIRKTPLLREAHRMAILHTASTGYDTTIWQGERRILTYYGWKPAPHNRRVTDEPQTANRRKGDLKKKDR